MDIRKEFPRYSETDNTILNIMLKRTLHTGPALVGFFGAFFFFPFFIFNPSLHKPCPHPHIHTPLLKKNVLLGQA